MENYVETPELREKVVPGILGAFLFSLSAAVVWFILWQLGYVAGLSGVVGVICAIKGYEIFSKKSSVKGVVIASVCTVVSVLIGWYCCICYAYYQDILDLAELYPDHFEALPLTDFIFSGFEYFDFRAALDLPVLSDYLSNLAFGLVFTVIGAVGYIVTAAKNAKLAKIAAPAPAAPVLNGEESDQDSAE